MHECSSHEEWLNNTHYMCPCGHVEWAHYGDRTSKQGCSHCNCTQYRGETRPLTDYEKAKWTAANEEQAEGRFERGKTEQMRKYAEAHGIPIIELNMLPSIPPLSYDEFIKLWTK
jgi:hypothetical protein